MILALEAADSWRLTCSECTPALQKQRGCKKPGFSIPLHGNPFRFDSPVLQPAPDAKDSGLSILYECPTGFILRESPWIYRLIEAASRDENLSPAEYGRMSTVYHSAARIYRSETARLRERRDHKAKSKRDAAYGANVLKQRVS